MMVIYLPVKFEFDWTICFEFRKRKMWTDRWTDKRTKKRTNRRNYTNFKRNLAMMVIYLPVKFEFDWTNCFEFRKRKMWTDRWTDKRTKKRTNRRNYTIFERKSYDGDLCPCQV